MSIRKLVLLFVIIAAIGVGAATAHAGSYRTWVSGTGNDTGSCTRTAPCLTFAYAIGQTNSGGEINCLDPGGFSPVTITISVTIECEGVSYGAIQVSSGNAITINTAGVVVNLIGLDIEGEDSTTPGPGVNITAPAVVNIRNCKVYGFSSNTGIYFSPSASGGILVLDNVLVANNGFGIYQDVTSGAANMTVRNSTISNNSYGIYMHVAGGTHAGATIEQTTLAFNSEFALSVGSSAVALIGGSTVVNNSTGVAAFGGTIYSFKNNQIGGNNIDGTPLTAYPGGPLN